MWETHNLGAVTLTKIWRLNKMPGDKHAPQSSRCNAVWSKFYRCPFNSIQKMWPVLFLKGRALSTEVRSLPVHQNHIGNFKINQICPWPNLANLEIEALNKLGCIGPTRPFFFFLRSFPGNSNEVETPLLPLLLNRALENPKFWQGLCCQWVHQEKIQSLWKASPKWCNKP